MAIPIEKEDIVQLIGFFVGPKLLGADILSIREILRNPELEPIQKGIHRLKGIVRLRGEVIPVLDMADCIRHQQDDTGGKSWLLVTRNEDLSIGYLVDSVTNILRVGSDTILPAPEIITAGLRSQYFNGVCETEKGLLVVLNLDRMLDKGDYQQIRAVVKRQG